MGWNFIDDDVPRVSRSVLRTAAPESAATEEQSTDWPRVHLVLMRVLGRFPEARDAFVQAIQEAFKSKRDPVPQWAT